MEEHHGVEGDVGGHRGHRHHAAAVRRPVPGGVPGPVRASQHRAGCGGERGQGRGHLHRDSQPRRRRGGRAQGHHRRAAMALRVGRRGAEGPRERRILHDVHDSRRLLGERGIGRRQRTREGAAQDRVQPEREHAGVADRRDGVERGAHARERHRGHRVLDDGAQPRGQLGQGHPDRRRRRGRPRGRSDYGAGREQNRSRRTWARSRTARSRSTPAWARSRAAPRPSIPVWEPWPAARSRSRTAPSPSCPARTS